MAVMVRNRTLLGMTRTIVGHGDHRSTRRVGDIQIAQSVKYAAKQIYRQHKQGQPNAQTARQG